MVELWRCDEKLCVKLVLKRIVKRKGSFSVLLVIAV